MGSRALGLGSFPRETIQVSCFSPCLCTPSFSSPPWMVQWVFGRTEKGKRNLRRVRRLVRTPPVAFACCSPSGITTHTLWALTIYGKIKSQITSPGPHSLALDPTWNSRRIPYFLDLKQELIDFRKMLKKRWVLECLEDLEAHRVPTSAPFISELSSPSTSDKRKEPDCH